MKFQVTRIPDALQDEFIEACDSRNLSFFYPFAIVLAAAQAFFIVFQSIRFGADVLKLNYFYIYISAFTVGVVYTFIFSRYKKHPEKQRPFLLDLFFVLSLIGISLGTSVIELYYGTTTNTMFIAMMFFVATMVHFKITYIWSLLTISLAIHTVFCFLATEITMNEKIGLLLNNLLLFCMFIPCATTLHNARVRSFSQQKEINETNITLKRANIKLEQLNMQLEVSSKTDSLTGVLNRNAFNAALDLGWHRSLSLKDPVTAIMIDVDFFKNYNDRYGHIEGDNCLKSIAAAIKKSLHRHGDCVYRFGGEEFVILLFGADVTGSESIQARIVEAVADLGIVRDESGDLVTVSIGINTEVAAEGETPEGFIARADTALYYAKNHGRNKVVRYDDIKDLSF